MTIIAAVPDSAEGLAALSAAVTEAERVGTDVVAVNLGLRPIGTDGLSDKVQITVVERAGRADADPVDAVLEEIVKFDATRLVVGIKRRSAVGKALLGSVSQRLLLDSPIPVLGVKIPK